MAPPLYLVSHDRNTVGLANSACTFLCQAACNTNTTPIPLLRDCYRGQRLRFRILPSRIT